MSGPSRVVKGVRVRTDPGKKRRVNVVMNPESLRLFAYRFFMLGFNETGAGFHGEYFKNRKLTPQNLKAIRDIMNARFNRAYTTREGT